MTTRKVGVIGLRNIGMGHVRSWHQTPGVKVVAVADLDEERRRRACDEVGDCAGFGDYRELLEHSDAEIVSVCMPTGLHARVVAECLASGRHVLCEKPPANNAEEALQMAEAAAKAGRLLGYSLQRRFEGPVQSARAVAQRGDVGDLFYGRAIYARNQPWSVASAAWATPWRFDESRGGGSMLDLGIHVFDVAWYIMGCPQPISVAGFTSTRYLPLYAKKEVLADIKNPADDTAMALIRFEGDKALLLESSFGLYRLGADESSVCELSGTQGGLSIYPPGVVRADGTLENLGAPESHPGPQLGVKLDFLQALESGSDPCVSTRQGVQLMRIFDAVRQSSREGREVPILPA